MVMLQILAMDDPLSGYKEQIVQGLTQLSAWLNDGALSWWSLGQVMFVAFVLLCAHALARKSGTWLQLKIKNKLHLGAIRIHASYQEIFFLIYSVALIWSGTLIAEGAGLPHQMLRIMVSLATAWAVIRFTSSVIQTPFWSRLIALVLWSLAALNIVGWLGPVIEIMDKAAVTVGDFRLSVLIVAKSLLAFGVLFWSVRIVSAMLERLFYRSQGLTPSQRVLFQKLSNIILFTLATVIGLNIVGIDLTALTVFSGALGLGIGFGLQKVFSNLISGLILLVDKSVKPGDVVTVGDTFGWVNKLSARHVSVLTRDGKEHLIPNENLITQEVVNWSYSNRHVRIHVPFGVSYNADLYLVRDLVLQAAKEHKRVLNDPQPMCFLTAYGNSSVDHELIIWIMDPQDGLMNIRSDLYYRIWDLFKENNVEIPFPQRDVHLKYDAGGLEMLQKAANKKAS